MIILAFFGGILVAAVVAAVIYDHRARRRGWRVGVSSDEAFQNRLDVEATDNPFLQGGKHDWMTYQQRDKEPPDQ